VAESQTELIKYWLSAVPPDILQNLVLHPQRHEVAPDLRETLMRALD
jgi:hypothetical protein